MLYDSVDGNPSEFEDSVFDDLVNVFLDLVDEDSFKSEGLNCFKLNNVSPNRIDDDEPETGSLSISESTFTT